MKKLNYVFALALFAAACSSTEPNTAETTETEIINEEEVQPMSEETTNYENIVIETSMGKMTAELYPDKAPATVANFLSYVDEGYYNGTIFHRVISNFMAQGGGFTPDGNQKETKSPIVLESDNGLKNDIGTLAMARTNAPNSATSQFFINVNTNDFLNYRPNNPGYAVFGKITSGMEVLNEIRQVKTGQFQGYSDWPAETVLIEKIYREE